MGTQEGTLVKPPIFVVEDEQDLRQLTSKVLEDSGYVVIKARDGVEGLDLLKLHRNEKFLIVSDIRMSNLSANPT